MASRATSGLGSKRAGDHDHAGLSGGGPESPLKRIKVEATSDDGFKVPMYGGFVDLTGSDSDDEPVTMTKVKETSGPTEPKRSGEDKMTDVVYTPTTSSRTNVPSGPFHFSRSSTVDGDDNIRIIETSKPPTKKVVTTGPFNCDDDSSDSDSETVSATRRPAMLSRRTSPTPQRNYMQNEKLAEEKAAQLKYAVEKRAEAEAKKAARVLLEERSHGGQQSSGSSSVQRPTPQVGFGTMADPSHGTPVSAQKPAGASRFDPGRKKEPGRLPSAIAATTSTSSHGRSEAQKLHAPSRHSTPSAGMVDRATPMSSVTRKPAQAIGNSQRHHGQPANLAQSRLPYKNGKSIQAPSSTTTAFSPLAKKNASNNVFPGQEAWFANQPSIAADHARSDVERLREMPSSLASASKDYGQKDLSRAQNEELFGEHRSDIEQVPVAAIAKPNRIVNVAAQQEAEDLAAKKDQMCKEFIAKKLSEAQKDAARAEEQSRLRIDEKADTDRRAQEAAFKKKRELAENLARATKERQARLAKEAQEQEKLRAQQQKVDEGIKQREEQRVNAQQDRARKLNERNARMHVADAQAEAKAAAAARDDGELGELVLEDEPTPSRNRQMSKDVSAARLGQGSTTQTGPVSLNSAMGTNSVMKSIEKPEVTATSMKQRIIQQQKDEWKARLNEPTSRGVAKTPASRPQGTGSAFFTNPGARNSRREDSVAGATQGGTKGRDGRTSHGRRLGTILPQDAKLIQWKGEENLPWDQISTLFEKLTGLKRAGSTLNNRWSQIRGVLKKAGVSATLLQKLAIGDLDAQREVNAMVEEGFNATPAPAPASEPSKTPLQGGGPIKLGPLDQLTPRSGLWRTPTPEPEFEFEEEEAEVSVAEPRPKVVRLRAPQARPTTGGKCLNTLWRSLNIKDNEADAEDLDSDVEYESSAEEEDTPDPWEGREAEDFQPYGFQVQRRELTTDEAESGLSIDNQEWMSCGHIFMNCGEANGAAMAEIVTIMPGGAFYANPADAPRLEWLESKTDRLDRFVFCQLTNPIHGVVQTTVKKVIQAPRARMPPPTVEEFGEELNVRTVWYFMKQVTIYPPNRNYDPLFDVAPPEPRVEEEGRLSPYTDYDLVTKRAVQSFVDATYKSDLQSLDSRSEEKREKVEQYMAGILADKTFDGEMEIVEGMEGMAAIRQKYKIEEGSKIVLGIWIDEGLLRGPLN